MQPEPGSKPPERIAEDGPTELVPDDSGDLVERLSGGTATLLLVWLVGIGAASALLAVWVFGVLVMGTRLGMGDLFGGPGLYTAVAGAAGPCVLWLAGRAQGHSLGWFTWTALKVGLVMVALVFAFFFGSMFFFGLLPGLGALIWIAVGAVLTAACSVIWALATWSADRYIARARVEGVDPGR